MDVNANVVYDFVAFDAYYALTAKTLHLQANADLNSFEIPVAVTLYGKNNLFDERTVYADGSPTSVLFQQSFTVRCSRYITCME